MTSLVCLHQERKMHLPREMIKQVLRLNHDIVVESLVICLLSELSWALHHHHLLLLFHFLLYTALDFKVIRPCIKLHHFMLHHVMPHNVVLHYINTFFRVLDCFPSNYNNNNNNMNDLMHSASELRDSSHHRVLLLRINFRLSTSA